MNTQKTHPRAAQGCRIALRFMVLFCCTSMLTSCSTVGSLLNYLVSLPFNIINAVLP